MSVVTVAACVVRSLYVLRRSVITKYISRNIHPPSDAKSTHLVVRADRLLRGEDYV